MCGIAGWVDFARDLTVERPIVRKMMDTMALRGPDDEGMWVRPRVALAHRRLSVIDLEGGRQPMLTPETLPDGTPVAAISYSGEVYNFAELRAELVLLGHRFATRSDTEVVLRAYLQWGPEFVGRLNGMFAFAIWDSRSEELLLYRDRLGIKPLFYYPIADGLLFGSEPKAVLAHPDSRAVLSLEGLRYALSFVRVPGQTPLEGLYEVRPGHVLRVRDGHRFEQRYWELTSRPHTDDVDTTVARVRELLTDIVARQLVADVPLCTLLSGGLDSSALTALAQRTLDSDRIRSFSVDFVGQVENFEPERLREAPDTPFAMELVRHVGTVHREILLNNADLVAAGVREAVLRAWDLPYGDGDLGPSLYLLFRAVAQQSTVALSGESADEVFGGYLWFHDPRVVESDTFPWHAIGDRPVAEQSTAFLDPELAAKLALPEYIADHYHSALAEVPQLAGESGHDRRMRAMSHLNLTRWLPVMLDRKDRLSMANGIEVRVPFCDHRLVEYVFNVPWSMKTFDGREKSLLRAATKDLLPQSIVERRKAPYPSTQDPGYDRAMKQVLGKIVAEPTSPALPLFDLDAIQKHLETPVRKAGSMQDRGLVNETPIRLNEWLDAYDVRLAL
ncbi:asparagine synthase (glutamine-hydrolyzing) [Nocardia sp. CDC159]|uniref:asparagine synthase (glutamine-hydrolyzing) n=1 Tax=Nocardia pulmonis TaxID=2951408 RepID=A0A9X2EF37_9NOCA|nr:MULTISPECIES: asparagine synthase (glutamine-hydrolyzing) [Nocardia]MCM6778290.1 asparagine synthase (glutamine-hydrolyzing) [Nocardia pulmonis]MCM6791179.1 asparagine synthase (glutamine-hydrolyzing) [Nocardia sp. CDC159]